MKKRSATLAVSGITVAARWAAWVGSPSFFLLDQTIALHSIALVQRNFLIPSPSLCCSPVAAALAQSVPDFSAALRKENKKHLPSPTLALQLFLCSARR
ncbi:unnamed protein product [Linum trigynum]|uniref:Secreted protein n=1 Tax=Linum trigynum TaxID=586398 RepID=A0AAV2CCL7_9ROSI